MHRGATLGGELPSDCGAILRRFEAAWQGPAPPDLDDFLPPVGTVPDRLLSELIQVDLDFRLRRGESARIEGYLRRYPRLERDRSALLELMFSEYALRICWGAGADAEDYPRRFPEYADQIRARLAAATDVTRCPGRASHSSASAFEDRPAPPGHEVMDELGRGGMGVVYRARQAALGRVVALKTILSGDHASEEEGDRFRREAEVIARLDHPHIVPVYEVGEYRGRPYFSMKYFPGGSLGQRARGPGTDLRAQARLVETIARAIHHAHQRGILHRDLKPSNILLDEAGQPHVADFGLAKRFDPDAGASLESGVVGSPGYMAPEQARGDQAITTVSDVYGLGAILYELLTGRPPFQAETVLATLAEVVERPPQRPRLINPGVPADLETICLKCLEKEPERRYGGAAELADDLGRWRRGEPISGRPVGRLEGLARWCRRNPRDAAIAMLGVALLLMAVGGAWWLDRRQAEHREDLARQEARRQAEQELLREQGRGRVQDALAQLPSLRRRFLWDEAESILARTEGEADNLGLVDLLADAQQAQRELALAARLDQIQLDASTFGERSASSQTEAARAYREAFQAHGLDLEAGDIEDLTRRIRDSAIREELVTALDHWAEADLPLRPRLLAVARGADPGPWKDRLRDPALWKDRAELKAQMTGADISQLTPTLLARLGRLLSEHRESLDLLRGTQRRHPDDFWLNARLGEALYRRGQKEEAIGYLQAALAVRPHGGAIHNNLGVALRETGRLEEAVASFEEALRRDPLLYQARNNLGVALWDQARVDEAIAAYRQVIRDRSDYAPARTNLGNSLEDLGRIDEAIAAHRQALDLQPDSAAAQINLARALRSAGQLADALVHFRRGDELGKKIPTWRYPSADFVRDCERELELEDRLPALLEGEARPSDADECLVFAKLCRSKGLHATATRLYAEAFAAGAGGSASQSRRARSAAARSAALAAAGRTPDADGLDDARRAELRQLAFEWLTSVLMEFEQDFERDGKKARPAMEDTLRSWRRVYDLAGVRHEEELARLPEAEAQALRDYWKSVTAPLAR